MRLRLSAFIYLTILGAILFGGLLNVQFFRVQAQSISADVGNEGPIIVPGSEKICDNTSVIPNTDIAITGCSNISTISLSAGSSRSLSFFAKARDNNTNADIPAGPFKGTFYQDTTSSGSESCIDDNNNCYQLDCSKVVDITTAGGTDAWLRCDFNLDYYADHSAGSAEWLGYIEVFDQSLVGGNNSSSYATEVEKLISATFPVVNFGAVEQGSATVSSDNITVLHQNNGNVVIDYLISLDDDDANDALDCATGALISSNIAFDIVDVGYAGSAYTLISEPSTVELNIDVLQRTNDAAPTLNDNTGDIQRSYWNVNVPSSGAEGFCDEGLNVTVFEGP